ncbi:acyl-CoA desaturase [Wenzhouxiangella sp. AB-CW3]|uniref:acyl-CoA desaturase n=1 Tax=Wenzhouxiangella sp. AB-CW3 TaxID=2771012 RepID=UPI00168BD45A|nr:acyl-CoA desaturase [Wenzhouxiangella sp. AB-CW3]QOC23340.1 acyl-CoA desaturase [Wenzhouxiangella sp. AB-CW3]
MNPFRIWLDSGRYHHSDNADPHRIDWLRILPFIGLHLACLGVLLVGVSATALVVFLASYLIRMFAITAFYHRYFSHRAFRTSRPMQFAFALLGASATQRGPLWWAAHHRQHHRHADTSDDPHSPSAGFWWSHMGWFLSRRHFGTDLKQVPDLARYPELRWLDRFDLIVPVLYAAGLFGLGLVLERWAPGLNTSGWQLLVWGYFVSTVVLIHVTLTINSLAHVWGSRRFETRDDSRNNGLLALLTLGEGWHNNHHHFPGSARQGFYWWEVDISYYVLWLMARVRLIHGLKSVPERVLNARRIEASP